MLVLQSQLENLNLLASEAETWVRWFQFLEIRQNGGQVRPNGAFLDTNILENSVEFRWVISTLEGRTFCESSESGIDIVAFLAIMRRLKVVDSKAFARLIMDTNADEEGRGAEVQPLPTTYYNQEREYITCEQAVKAPCLSSIYIGPKQHRCH
ncbi:hypothetical protein ACA910_009621 [Epithemia clementina (nom. ined.)]